MKMRNLILVLCTIAALSVALAGCRKKARPEDTETPQTPSNQLSLSDLGDRAAEKANEVAKTANELKDKTVAKVLDLAQQFQADQESTIPEISARAKEMAVENLRTMAEKYHVAITAAQRKVKELTEQFVAMPDAEKDRPEGVKLKTALDEVYKSIQPLKERFQVYYNALKEKAGDLKGLEL